MKKWNAAIIIIFVGILGILAGIFVVEWSERQKPKNRTLTKYSVVTPVTIVDRVEPTYPASALRDRIEGVVRLVVKVAENGSVSSTTVVKGVRADIDSAAVEAVKAWKFAPGPAMTILSLNFELAKTKKSGR